MSRPLHIVFACYYSLRCNSGAQLHSLANHLVRRGHQVTVFVPFDPAATLELGETLFTTRSFADLGGWLAESAAALAPGRAVLHVWTPRENVRKFTQQFTAASPLPYIVHLEDNEPLITASNLGAPFDELAGLEPGRLTELVGDRLTHPHHFRPFLAGAAGITALIDRLMEFAPSSARQLVFWPGYDETLFSPAPRNDELRRQHGIAATELCLVYAGNVASANRDEVRSLYLSVAVLQRMGLPAKLIRAGEDYAPLFDQPLPEVDSRVISLGRLPHQDIPALYAMADFLVQPGRAGPFNDYRFPSKLPEFFASGRPVLLPGANLGRFVRDGIDALVLQDGHAMEIAEKIAGLVRVPGQVQQLAENAARFAQEHFQWRDIAKKMEGLYLDVLSGPSPSSGPPVDAL